MPSRVALVLVVLLGSTLAAPSVSQAVDVYSIDPTHTSVVFGVGHNGLSFVYGFFRKAQGAYSLDPRNEANCRFQFTVDAASIDTNLAARDTHLQSPQFLDVARFPQITFKSTSCRISNTAEGGLVYYVTGDLTIRDVTRQVTIPLQMLGEGEGAQKEDGTKDRRTAFMCRYDLKRSDYGMNSVPMVGNGVGITISFEGVLQRNTSTALR